SRCSPYSATPNNPSSSSTSRSQPSFAQTQRSRAVVSPIRKILKIPERSTKCLEVLPPTQPHKSLFIFAERTIRIRLRFQQVRVKWHFGFKATFDL
ncbi:hypothetical protein M5D96_010849, partial [Drosophila gunungcola]